MFRRILSLLNGTERQKAAMLFVGILTNSVVEILGLAVIIPVIGLIVEPDIIESNPNFFRAYEFCQHWGVNSYNDFLLVLCVGLILAFAFKALYGIGISTIQSRFSFSVAHRMSGQMWAYHFSQSLEKLRSSESGKILTEINAWPIHFAQAFMIGGLIIISECSVILFISGGLFLYNPIVLLSIFTMVACGWYIIRTITKKKLEHYSQLRKIIEPRTNTLINNAIRGCLELITFRATDAVKKNYLNQQHTVFRVNSNSTVFHFIPAKLYEVLAVGAISVTIIITVIQGTPNHEFVELLTLMTVGAYRIMPSLSRINGSIMQMRGQAHILQAIERSVHYNKSNRITTIDRVNLGERITIELEGMELGYQGKKDPVLQGLNHTFLPGKIHAIIGPSGSGKTTLVNAMLGLHPLRKGRLKISCDQSHEWVLSTSLSVHEWLLRCGYLSQEPFLFQGTLKENLTFQAPDLVLDEQRIHHIAKQLDLHSFLGEDLLEFPLAESGNNLSGGQKQRIGLLRALQSKRQILMLDEATSALDSSMRDQVLQLLRNEADSGCNVIIVTHDELLAKACDSILNLQEAG